MFSACSPQHTSLKPAYFVSTSLSRGSLNHYRLPLPWASSTNELAPHPTRRKYRLLLRAEIRLSRYSQPVNIEEKPFILCPSNTHAARTHTHTHTQPSPRLWPPHQPSHQVTFRGGSVGGLGGGGGGGGCGLERRCCKGLWETVERPMRALQTDCCRASPPTYDCSPAVAVATAVLDGRRSYFSKREVCVCVCAHAYKRVCVYACLFKSWKPNSSELTLVLNKGEEAHSMTLHLDNVGKKKKKKTQYWREHSIDLFIFSLWLRFLK